jgi:peptidyl-prolyl cis-trans isomerase A (cyclophilin A)
MNPAQLNETAPEKFQAKFDTSKGEIIIEVTRAWAPNGADRFYNLVKNGYYDNCRFFRVVENFMVQFGINGDPKLNTVWRMARIQDDKVKQSNDRGFVTYAMAGPNTRTTQLFINFRNNAGLDSQGFSPFGKVKKGMDVVDSIYNKYGEKPDQGRIQMEGNAYLEKNFPSLDYIKSAAILPAEGK